MVNLVIAAVAAIVVVQGVAGNVQKQCTDESKSLLLVRDGLKDFKSLNKAAKKKLTFVSSTADLEQACEVVKKYGKHSVVWELSKKDLKAARKLRKKSKKLKKIVKSMIKSYKKATGKKLKMIIIPSGTSNRIVKAFEKKHIVVIKSERKLSKRSKVKKFIKKVRKASKKNEYMPGSIVSFTVTEKNGAKQLKKLRRALSIVNAKKCFKKQSKKDIESEAGSEPIGAAIFNVIGQSEAENIDETRVPSSDSDAESAERSVLGAAFNAVGGDEHTAVENVDDMGMPSSDSDAESAERSVLGAAFNAVGGDEHTAVENVENGAAANPAAANPAAANPAAANPRSRFESENDAL